LFCPAAEDRFTASTATVGNKVLPYPAAVISMDEEVLIGYWFIG
jgi:hypothetical protein